MTSRTDSRIESERSKSTCNGTEAGSRASPVDDRRENRRERQKGGGLVGSTLAGKLAADGHDVVIVEQNRGLLAGLSGRLDVQTLAGNGATVPALLEAGIESCDIVFATTNSDEANMVVALVGSSLFRVLRVVARLRDPGHREGFRTLAAEVGKLVLAFLMLFGRPEVFTLLALFMPSFWKR